MGVIHGYREPGQGLRALWLVARPYIRRAFWFLVWLVVRTWALFCPAFTICAPDGSPYLRRWILSPWAWGKGRSLRGPYLHCFCQSDPDRGWHSHPWVWCKARLLRGSYYQDLCTSTTDAARKIRPFYTDQVYITGDIVEVLGETELWPADFHRVKLLTPRVWTYFWHGPKHGRGWGFLDKAGTYTKATPEQGVCP